jgi:hypothetical protein
MPATGTMWPVLRRDGASRPRIDTKGKWVGSKLGLEGDLVTKDANGRYDQAVAAGANIGANTKIAFLGGKVAATVAADGQAPPVEKLGDDELLELQAVDGAGAAVATTQAMEGDTLEIKRLASGQYAVDTSATANAKVEVIGVSPRYGLGEVGGYLLCRVLPAARLA